MSFVTSGYIPPQRPSPFARPVPEWHPTPAFSAHGARETSAVPGASVPHAAAAAAAARSAHAARVSAAKAQRRTRAAAAHCRRRGLGDGNFSNTSLYQSDAQGALTLPVSITPASEAAQTAAVQIPTSIQGNAALDAAINAALHPTAAPAPLTPYEQSLWNQGKAGYNIGTGLANSNATQVATGLTQLPSSAAAMAKANAPSPTIPWPKISIPWWAWVAVGVVGIAVLQRAA